MIAQHVGLRYIYGNLDGVDLKKAQERAHELFVDLQETVLGVDHDLDTDKDFRITYDEFLNGTEVCDWGLSDRYHWEVSDEYHVIASNDRQEEEAISPVDLLWEFLQRPDMSEMKDFFVFGCGRFFDCSTLEEDSVAIESGFLNYIRPSIISDKISEETKSAEAGFEFIRALVRGRMGIDNLNDRAVEYKELRAEHMRKLSFGAGISGMKL